MHTSSTSVRSWSAHVPVRRGRSPARRRSAQGVRSATTAPMRGRDWDKRMMADRGDEVVKAVTKLCRRQSQMSIIEAVRKYLQTCPLLKGGTLNVGFPAAGRHLLGGRCAGKAGPQGVHGRIQPAAVPVRAGDPHLLRRVCPPAARQPVLFRGVCRVAGQAEPNPFVPRSRGRTKRAKNWRSRPLAMFSHPIRTRHGIRSSAACPYFQKRRTINETFRTDEESHAEHEL